MTRKLVDILRTIGDETQKLSHHSLSSLSDVNTQELMQFQSAWAQFTPTRRRELVQAMADLADEQVAYDFRRLFRWLLDDQDADVRVAAIEALWEDEHLSLIPIFQRLLEDDPISDVRAAAAAALGRFLFLAELEEIPTDAIADAVQALWDQYHRSGETIETRCQILVALAYSSRPAVDHLIEEALFSSELPLRATALTAMGATADPRWVPFLVPELNQEEAILRLNAVNSLSALEARQAVRPLIQLIARESDLEVRLAALAALGEIGGPEARRALEAATEWDDEATAAAAEEALGELLSNEGGDFELISQVMGKDEEDEEGLDWDEEDDYEEDPLERELRRLLDERD